MAKFCPRLFISLTAILLFTSASPPTKAEVNIVAAKSLPPEAGVGFNGSEPVPPFAQRLAVNPLNGHIYINSTDKIIALDPATFAVRASSPGNGGILVHTDGKRIFVTDSTSVRVLDAESLSPLDTITPGGALFSTVLDGPENRLYVLGKTSTEDADTFVYVYESDGTQYHRVDTLSFPSAISLEVDPAAHRLYVGVYGSPTSTIHVIDGVTLKPVKSISLPIRPQDIRVTPQNGRLYVTQFAPPGGTVAVVEEGEDAPRIQVGFSFEGIERTPPDHPDEFSVEYDPATELLYLFGAFHELNRYDIFPSRFSEALVLQGPNLQVVGREHWLGGLQAVGKDTAAVYAVTYGGTATLYTLKDAPSVDSTPPVGRITTQPPANFAGWVRAPITSYAIEVTDAPGGLGVQGIHYVMGVFSGCGFRCPPPDYEYHNVFGERVEFTPSPYYVLQAGSVLDRAGNRSEFSVTLPRVDLTIPETTVAVAATPSPGQFSVTLDAKDPPVMRRTPNAYEFIPMSGVEDTWFSLDGGDFLRYAQHLTLSGDRPHTLRYYSKDVAGNVEETKTKTLPAQGDVNRDGSIDVSDVVLTLRAAIGLKTLEPEQRLLADLNGDVFIDVKDAILILMKIVSTSG